MDNKNTPLPGFDWGPMEDSLSSEEDKETLRKIIEGENIIEPGHIIRKAAATREEKEDILRRIKTLMPESEGPAHVERRPDGSYTYTYSPSKKDRIIERIELTTRDSWHLPVSKRVATITAKAPPGMRIEDYYNPNFYDRVEYMPIEVYEEVYARMIPLAGLCPLTIVGFHNETHTLIDWRDVDDIDPEQITPLQFTPAVVDNNTVSLWYVNFEDGPTVYIRDDFIKVALMQWESYQEGVEKAREEAYHNLLSAAEDNRRSIINRRTNGN